MPTFYTDVAEKQNNYLKTTAGRADDGSKVSGDVLFATNTYTFVGTEVDADVLNLVKLPEGATVIPHLCQIYANFPTNDEDCDVSIGDDDDTTLVDPDRYSTLLAIDAVGTGVEAFDFAHATAAAGLTPYRLQKNSWIQALLGGLANVTAGDSISFRIAYRAQS